MEQVESITSSYHTKKYVSDNKYFVDSLKFLKERIESTNSFHQIEILKIFNDNGVFSGSSNFTFNKTRYLFKTFVVFLIFLTNYFWLFEIAILQLLCLFA